MHQSSFTQLFVRNLYITYHPKNPSTAFFQHQAFYGPYLTPTGRPTRVETIRTFVEQAVPVVGRVRHFVRPGQVEQMMKVAPLQEFLVPPTGRLIRESSEANVVRIQQHYWLQFLLLLLLSFCGSSYVLLLLLRSHRLQLHLNGRVIGRRTGAAAARSLVVRRLDQAFFFYQVDLGRPSPTADHQEDQRGDAPPYQSTTTKMGRAAGNREKKPGQQSPHRLPDQPRLGDVHDVTRQSPPAINAVG
jgi:hypothetical protein